MFLLGEIGVFRMSKIDKNMKYTFAWGVKVLDMFLQSQQDTGNQDMKWILAMSKVK